MRKFIIHTQDLVSYTTKDLVFYTNYAKVVENRLFFKGIIKIGYSVKGEGEFCCCIDLIKCIEKDGIIFWHRNQSEEKLKKIMEVKKNEE